MKKIAQDYSELNFGILSQQNRFAENKQETEFYTKHPLTREQKAVFMEWIYDKNSADLNTCVEYKIEGFLDTERFRDACIETSECFDSLKFYFEYDTDDKEIFQYYTKNKGSDFNYIDLSLGEESLEERIDYAKELLRKKSLIAFNPDDKKQNLSAFYLVKVDEHLYFFSTICHHIVCDARSANIFVNILSYVYKNGITVTEKYKSEDSSFLVRLDNYNFDIANLESKKLFWANYLGNTPLNIDFSNLYSYKIPESKINKPYVTSRIFFSDIDSKKIKYFITRKAIISDFIFYSAVWSILQKMYTHSSEFVFGYQKDTSITDQLNSRDVFACFTKLLPLKISLSNKDSLKDIFEKQKMDRKNIKENFDIELSDILSSASKGEGLNSYINETFLYSPNFSLDNLEVKPLPAEIKFRGDLSIAYAYDKNNGFIIEIGGKRELFEQTAIDGMANSFKLIIDHILTKAESQDINNIYIGDIIKDVAKADNQEVINQNTDTAYEQNLTLYQLFEKQVIKTPHNTALIVDGGFSITYQELQTKVDILANYLLHIGIEHQDIIAISIKKSLNLLVSTLATIKVGAIFVPIDPNYPEKRKQIMLEEASAKIILFDNKLQKNVKNIIQNYSNAHFVYPIINEHNIQYDKKESVRNYNKISSEDTAYIIFTSGSTGKPKGVPIKHRQVNNCIKWLETNFILDEGSVIFQNFSSAFDPSIYETFWPLTTGKILCYPNISEMSEDKNVSYIASILKDHNIAYCGFIPSHLHAFLKYVESNNLTLPSLKYIMSGGDALFKETVKDFYKTLPNCKFYNLYGLTETTIFSTTHYCDPNIEYRKAVPIGKAIPNHKIYILNNDMNFCPPNVMGEMYIGGSCITDGYINNEELNKKLFLDNPFAKGERLYRTGDLARYDADGNVIFIGRINKDGENQIKISGHRIDLSEVESSIMSIKKVSDVCVLIKNENNKNFLIAYVIHRFADESLLKQEICEHLPHYMIPQFIISMDEFPRLHNGEVDLDALPKKDFVIKKDDFDSYSEIEQRMILLWSSILKIDKKYIGLNDRFDELGGDSLEIMNLATELKKEFGIDKITMTDFIQCPTINKQIAKYIKNKRNDSLFG